MLISVKRNWKNTALKILLSVCFFIFLTKFLKGAELISVFKNVNWFYFALSFLLIPIMLVASCMKWKIIFDAGGVKVPFSKLISIYLVGYFFSNLLPSNVGGDLVRTYYAGKETGSLSFSAVTVFIERFSGVIFLLVLVCISPFVMPTLRGNLYIIIPACCAFILLVIIAFILRLQGSPKEGKAFFRGIFSLMERAERKVEVRPIRFLIKRGNTFATIFIVKLEKFFKELQKALITVKGDRSYFIKLAVLTVLFYALTWVNVYVAFLTFGVNIDFLIMIALVPTIMFVAHLPVTLLGNLGFFESVFVFYFMFAGVPGESTLAMGLLLRMKLIFLGILGFVVYLFYRRTWGSYNSFSSADERIEE